MLLYFARVGGGFAALSVLREKLQLNTAGLIFREKTVCTTARNNLSCDIREAKWNYAQEINE